jgi:signal transduction histidine kinase
MPSAGNVAFALLVVGGGWLAGRVVHARREEARRLEQLAIERGVQARTAVLEERARIARELHDIVAHSVSVMVVQAGAAGEVLDRDPEQARSSLELIQDSGHQALQELRRLLGVLRSGEEPEPLVPAPGLARLPELVQDFRDAGLVVEVSGAAFGTELEPGVDLAAYRVAQEALTNALKHGGKDPVVLDIRHRGGGVVVSVVGGRNDESRPRSTGPASGHGLIGMRERVAACGGRLEAGWEPDRRFAVRAWLPGAEAAP